VQPFDEVNKVVREILHAYRAIGHERERIQRGWVKEAKQRTAYERIEKAEGVIWEGMSTAEDEIQRRMNGAVANIEAICEPVLRGTATLGVTR